MTPKIWARWWWYEWLHVLIHTHIHIHKIIFYPSEDHHWHYAFLSPVTWSLTNATDCLTLAGEGLAPVQVTLSYSSYSGLCILFMGGIAIRACAITQDLCSMFMHNFRWSGAILLVFFFYFLSLFCCVFITVSLVMSGAYTMFVYCVRYVIFVWVVYTTATVAVRSTFLPKFFSSHLMSSLHLSLKPNLNPQKVP